MKRLEIKSFDDPNFLKLGLFCLLLGAATYLTSLWLEFPGIIALRAGGGTGLFICLTYFLASYIKRQKKRE